MPLTEKEQAESLRFLGYANWQQLASSFQLGFPAASQPEFLIRDAFTRINEEGVELVRRDLRELRCIEDQMSSSRSRFKASKLGNMTLNPNEPMQLRRELMYWQGRLANDLGGYLNPFADSSTTCAGGRNAKVLG